MTLRAVIEVRTLRRDAASEITTDVVVEVRRATGEVIVLADPNAVLDVVDVTADRAILVERARPDRRHELEIGDRVGIATSEQDASFASWDLRLVTIRSVDARTMPGGTELERDLLAAISMAPEDDAPRLVYADWLMSQPDQGDRDRGELVQVQCALGASPSAERRRELRARERELLAVLPTPSFNALELVWTRGFLECCRGELGNFARNAVEVFQLAPLLSKLELDVATMPNQSLLWRLGTIEQTAQIRELVVVPPTGAPAPYAAGDTLLASIAPRLESLTHLRLSSMNVGANGVEALVAAPCAPQLALLDLSSNSLTGNATRALAASTRIQPATLRLASCSLVHHDVAALSRAAWLALLEELDLGDNAVQSTGAVALSQVPFRGLQRLALGSCGIREDGARTLLGSRYLGRLTHLRLHRNPIGNTGAIALSKSRARSIVELDLQSCAITDDGVIALAESPSVRAMRRLRLTGNPIGDAGARAILESVHLRDLEQLDISGDGLSADVREQIHRRFGDE